MHVLYVQYVLLLGALPPPAPAQLRTSSQGCILSAGISSAREVELPDAPELELTWRVGCGDGDGEVGDGDDDDDGGGGRGRGGGRLRSLVVPGGN